jgi:hypothetical protein
MAHCEICDFSETVRSDFYTSLSLTDPVGNKVVYDEKTDKWLCVDCIGASLANYRSIANNVSLPKEDGEIEYIIEDLENDPTAGSPSDFEELGFEVGDGFYDT